MEYIYTKQNDNGFKCRMSKHTHTKPQRIPTLKQHNKNIHNKQQTRIQFTEKGHQKLMITIRKIHHYLLNYLNSFYLIDR